MPARLHTASRDGKVLMPASHETLRADGAPIEWQLGRALAPSGAIAPPALIVPA